VKFSPLYDWNTRHYYTIIRIPKEKSPG